MGKLEGKVALVTGSSSGIGKAVALLFAREGADVIITSHLSIEEGSLVSEEVKSMGRKSIYVQADLSTQSGVDALFQQVSNNFTKIDVLVNNAGRTYNVEFDDISQETIDKDMSTNFMPTVLCSKAVLPFMKKGHIINTSSLRGLDYAGRPTIMGYCAAKSAINSFTKNLAYQLAPNIIVNAIAPGMTTTDGLKNTSVSLFDSWSQLAPLKKMITPEELAEVYLFLATTTIFTGSILVPDCGYSILAH